MRLEPIRTVEIGGKLLRLYPSLRYLEYGHEDVPWHCENDLRAILDLAPVKAGTVGRLVSTHLVERITVETPDGIRVVAPHFMGERALAGAACIRSGRSRAELGLIRDAYRAAALGAKRIMEANVAPGTRKPRPVAAYEDQE